MGSVPLWSKSILKQIVKTARLKANKTQNKWRNAAAVESRARLEKMCGLSVGYCVVGVIRGKEWCIIIQSEKLAERS